MQEHVFNKFSVIGASLSEPHIDELNVRNPYMFFVWYVRPSPAGSHRHYTSVRDIFLGPHENICATPLPRACHF